jgi:predicted MPP superfamily phosphohydrolase
MGRAHQAGHRWSRPWLVIAIAWVVLVGLTVGLHRLAWRATPGEFGETTEALIKHVANATQIATLPGWLVARGMRLWMDRPAAALVGASIGWGLWALGAILLMRLQRTGSARSSIAAHIRVNESRRAFVGSAAVACGVAGVGGIGGIAVMGAVINPLDLRVTRYRVAIRGLPREMDGFKIVQLTDLHLGARVPESMIRRAVDVACGLGADLFVLTGDYVERVDAHADRIGGLLVPLVRGARLGALGVLGNHDYYGDWRRVDASLRAVGVGMIDNRAVWIDAQTRGLVTDQASVGRRGLCIAGVQDLSEANPNLEGALAGMDAEMPRVVLSHNPDVAERTVKDGQRVDLLVCGHTHGGQVRLPLVGSVFVPSAYGDKYRYGLVDGPRCRVLISSGVGLSVMPIRIGVAPEVVEIVLAAE